ncbi:MAG TPA: TIGR03118 family protein [Pyrinomonadaceae bacterium]|nr:TIGR03118 family protein [Pyrinomonadaceae bacterium]
MVKKVNFYPFRFTTISLALIAAIFVSSFTSVAQLRTDKRNPAALTFGVIFRQTNLVANLPGVALIEDRLLRNPWGVSVGPDTPFCVVNNGGSSASLYVGDVSGGPLVPNPDLRSISIVPPESVVAIPVAATAVVANTTSGFLASLTPTTPAAPARFIFVTRNGAINAWQPGMGDMATVQRFVPGHNYTGVAITTTASGTFLLAADFTNGKIDVFDSSFNPASLPGNFADLTVPGSFRPFNIQNLGGALYVTYADLTSASGYVRKFDLDGNRITSFAIDNGPLAGPWGLAIAPDGSGGFSGLLLVGNVINVPFRASINAFTATGEHIGVMSDATGAALQIDNLHGFTFGNGVNGGDANVLYFAAGIFGQRHGLFGSLKPVTGIPPTTIKFSAASYSASETDPFVDITVTRSGVVGDPATVNYATVDDSAQQGRDYEIALGKITFNPGETSKTFRVLIIDDHEIGGGTAPPLFLALSNSTGAEIVAPSVATLSIMDNEFDTPRQPPNTNDDARLFVREHYLDFLNREPDSSGWDFWTNEITSCLTEQCREVKRINVSAAFFLAIEFQRTGPISYLANKAAFGNLPGAPVPVRYGQFMRDVQQLQRNLIFDNGSFETQLAANKQEYFNDFIARPEFVHTYAAMSNAQYVDRLIQNAGGGFPPSDRDAWVAGLNGGTKTRATVLREISERASFKQQEFNNLFVLMEYFGYLRRSPDDPPDNNFTGFNSWLTKLNSFNGDYIRSEMVKAFISSTEYRSRFGPP